MGGEVKEEGAVEMEGEVVEASVEEAVGTNQTVWLGFVQERSHLVRLQFQQQIPGTLIR